MAETKLQPNFLLPMASSEKDVKRKIKSIKSTRQITKAMELVATSKMKKAVDSATNLRAYGYLAFYILSKLSEKQKSAHPFFAQREVKNILIILFSTDKGLCGGLNTNILKKFSQTKEKLASDHPGAKFHFIATGKKGAEFLHRVGEKVEYVFPAFTNAPRFENILPISGIALKQFESGEFDKVILVYPEFISVLTQKPIARTLLPFSPEVFDEMMKEFGSSASKMMKPLEKKHDYTLEPSQEYILQNIVPQLTEVQLFQSVLEMTASEHSARMVAMQNATKAARDLLDDLVLTYNQARQSAITAQIAEISSSSAVLQS